MVCWVTAVANPGTEFTRSCPKLSRFVTILLAAEMGPGTGAPVPPAAPPWNLT